jgi:hypothetical protein
VAWPPAVVCCTVSLSPLPRYIRGIPPQAASGNWRQWQH